MTVKILIELAWRYWHWIVIALLIAIIAGVSTGYRERGYAIQSIKTEHKLALVTDQADHERQKNKVITDANEQVIQANKNGIERQSVNDIALANANAVNERLHQTVNQIQSDIVSAGSAARADYINSIGIVFRDCSTAYGEMAAIADRHANDAQTLRDANKRK